MFVYDKYYYWRENNFRKYGIISYDQKDHSEIRSWRIPSSSSDISGFRNFSPTWSTPCYLKITHSFFYSQPMNAPIHFLCMNSIIPPIYVNIMGTLPWRLTRKPVFLYENIIYILLSVDEIYHYFQSSEYSLVKVAFQHDEVVHFNAPPKIIGEGPENIQIYSCKFTFYFKNL